MYCRLIILIFLILKIALYMAIFVEDNIILCMVNIRIEIPDAIENPVADKKKRQTPNALSFLYDLNSEGLLVSGVGPQTPSINSQ